MHLTFLLIDRSLLPQYIAFDALIHTLFHLLRWGNQGNIHLLWKHRTGLSGLVAVIASIFITFPMMYFKKQIPYEVRKGLHYLFFVFAIGMAYHVPPSGVPNGGFISYVMGICLGLYVVDALYCYFFLTEIVTTTTFHVLPTGVQMTMPVSQRFLTRGERGGFAYVCLPWVNKYQWHPFSIFPNPCDPSQVQVFMQVTGDWTCAVRDALQRDTRRPVWVQGPFHSPYTEAVLYDNCILVASGIGVTPALNCIQSLKRSRSVHLIWMVRDPNMLEVRTVENAKYEF